mgnify:CR=1 FL=1
MYEKILVALDGSSRAEEVLPHVSALANRFDSRLVLVMVVPDVLQVMSMEAASATAMGGIMGQDMKILTEAMDNQAEGGTRYLEDTARRLRGSDVVVDTVVRRGKASDEIIRCAQEENVDLMAICTRGHGGLKRWMFGSVADYVLRSSGVPVLLITPSGDEV